MAQQRRNDRRPGGGRGGFERGGGGGFDRPDRGGFPRADRGGFERGGGERGGFERRDAAPRSSGFGARPATPRPSFRSEDEGGMNIRLTPRGLNALKTLAGELGMRPGELVTKWVEERLEAERAGGASPEARTALEARVEDLASRVAALEAGGAGSGATPAARRAEQTSPAPARKAARAAAPEATATSSPTGAATAPMDGANAEATPMPRRRGRPPKSAAAQSAGEAPAAPRGRPRKAATAATGKRVPLHEEIIAVIGERGPQTAAELATAITERGVFQPPRSGKPLDAATVNSRVSNPVYRARFRRDGHRIMLAEG